MAHDSGLDLIELSADDLSALRLAAQVMAHRAVVAGRPAVVLYFDSLESSLLAEAAARAQSDGPRHGDATTIVSTIDTAVSIDDRLLIRQYLALLAANDRLPTDVRRVFEVLRQGAAE